MIKLDTDWRQRANNTEVTQAVSFLSIMPGVLLQQYGLAADTLLLEGIGTGLIILGLAVLAVNFCKSLL